MTDEPLGKPGVMTRELREQIMWQLTHGGEAPPEPPPLPPAPEPAPPAEPPVETDRLRLEVVFDQKPPLVPPQNPSMPWRPYEYGDPVSITEVVLGNDATGEMVVVYPGSQEAAAHPWPEWTQVYTG